MQRSSDESTFQLDNVLPGFLARVNDLERRVAELENRAAPPVLTVESVAAPEFPQVAGVIIPTLGTALLGLAGAYLLRALAESGAAPRIATVAAALLYAGAWLAWSIRPRAAATFPASVYAVTAALIFAPLVWETTLRFDILTPAEAALILVLFVAAGFALACRRDLRAVSRITTIAAAGTAFGLLVATRNLPPFTLAVLAMASLEEYAVCRDRSLGGRWIAALACDVSLLVLAILTSRPRGLPEGYHPISTTLVVVTQLAALTIYGGSTCFRTLVRGLKITWFEAGQVTVIFAISLGAIVGVTRGAAAPALGCFCALAGIAAYLAAFLLADRRTAPRNPYAYSSWGLVLLLAGTAFLCSGGVLAAIWGTLAILAMYQGRRRAQIVLRFHACVYLIGAALASWLLRYCYAAALNPKRPGQPSHPRPFWRHAQRRSAMPPRASRRLYRCGYRQRSSRWCCVGVFWRSVPARLPNSESTLRASRLYVPLCSASQPWESLSRVRAGAAANWCGCSTLSC